MDQSNTPKTPSPAPQELHPSKSLVEKSYDSIAQQYLDWTISTPSPRIPWLQKLLTHLPPHPNVLELGCGAGVPCTQLLLQRGSSVTGVDISSSQLGLAKKHVPEAKLIKSDMMELELEEKSFDAVVGFYSVIHLPRDEQGVLMGRMRGWLKEGGFVLINLAVGNQEESQNGDWLGSGKGMFWSAWDEEGNLEMVRKAGFEIVESVVISDVEDGREVEFLWVLAKKT